MALWASWSLGTTRHYNGRVATDKRALLCPNKTLFKNQAVGRIWPEGYSLRTPDVDKTTMTESRVVAACGEAGNG